MSYHIAIIALHTNSDILSAYSLILDKQEAHEMLLRCQPGTFTVRFTESEAGGVSIVWVKSISASFLQYVHLYVGCLSVCSSMCV